MYFSSRYISLNAQLPGVIITTHASPLPMLAKNTWRLLIIPLEKIIYLALYTICSSLFCIWDLASPLPMLAKNTWRLLIIPLEKIIYLAYTLYVVVFFVFGISPVCPDAGCDHSRFLVVLTRIPDWYANGCCRVPRTEFCYFKQPTPTFLSAISVIMFHAKTSQTHDIPTKLRYWIPWTWKGHVLQAKNKYADSKSSAYLRGTWLKTKKYQTVILAYLRYCKYANYRTLPDVLTFCSFPCKCLVCFNLIACFLLLGPPKSSWRVYRRTPKSHHVNAMYSICTGRFAADKGYLLGQTCRHTDTVDNFCRRHERIELVLKEKRSIAFKHTERYLP
jgi:hypothetical protein